MALIECPECKNKISDQAVACPKCGYSLIKRENEETKLVKENKKNDNKKGDNKKTSIIYIVVGLIVVILIFWFINNKNEETAPTNQTTTYNQTSNDYDTYKSNYYDISFNYPKGNTIITGDDGIIYIGEKVVNRTISIPYTGIIRYDNFNSISSFFNSFTNYMKKEYSLTKISDLYTGEIGNKDVGAVTYYYNVNGKKIMDDRYAFVVNNKIYVVFTKTIYDETTNVPNVANMVIGSLKEGGF